MTEALTFYLHIRCCSKAVNNVGFKTPMHTCVILWLCYLSAADYDEVETVEKFIFLRMFKSDYISALLCCLHFTAPLFADISQFVSTVVLKT